MVRVPLAPGSGPNTANWLFITTGTGNRPREVEIKTTENGKSTLSLRPMTTEWVDLVLARVGGAVISLYRPDGGAWWVGARWRREDLPDTLQWGIAAYTDWDSFGPLQADPMAANKKRVKGQPDLRLTVDYVHFNQPRVPAGVDLLDAGSVPDATLVQLLTAEAPGGA
ncbi:hypothetical protein [Acrocarpospora sp. B8E8]|uniref:hypothetical protein n=1 Tax=Acrocarpospora sp. B8E8 TaxID=3153572 RepID=UPI00325F90F4